MGVDSLIAQDFRKVLDVSRQKFGVLTLFDPAVSASGEVGRFHICRDESGVTWGTSYMDTARLPSDAV